MLLTVCRFVLARHPFTSAVNLDFGHLKALASLDRNLCYALLPLTLDAEHAARTKLVRLITELEDEGLG